MTGLNLFVPISKIRKDGDRRIVEGYASTPALDLDDEIVELSAIKTALPDYMEWGAVRQMHQPMAVGTAKDATVDDNGLFFTARIVEPNCVRLIDEGVLKGFSIGGDVTAREGNRITGINLVEISVVDRPANPECRFEVVKAAKPIADSGIELVKIAPRDQITIEPEEARGLRKLFGKLFGKGGDAPGEGDKPYGDVKYADPGLQSDGKKRYPIDTEAHIRVAWNYIHKPKNREPYTDAQLKRIEAEIIAAWKDKIDSEGPPSAEEKAAKGAALRKYLVEVCDSPCPNFSAPGDRPNKELIDTQNALNALWSIVYLYESEASEDENEDAQLADLQLVIDRLKNFISSEILEVRRAAKAASAASITAAPADDPDGTSAIDRIDELFAKAKETGAMEISQMTLAQAQAVLAKRGASGGHAEHMKKGMAHLDEAMKCQKAAHGHMAKAIACHLDGMKAMKAAGGTLAKEAPNQLMMDALDHMHEAHGEMTKLAAHHALAHDHFGKALGSSPAESAGDEDDPEWAGERGEHADPIAAAAKVGVDVNALIQTAIQSATKAAFAEGQLTAFGNQPVPRKGVVFPVEKTLLGGSAANENPVAELFGGITSNDTPEDAALKAFTNMFANRGRFAKNVVGAGFAGQAATPRNG